MLNKIPKILSPDIVKYLMEMGHGDELIISDANFPTLGCPERIVRMDGHNIPDILEAILEIMPLDVYEPAVHLMSLVPGETFDPVIWKEYKDILKGAKYTEDFIHHERYDFYDKAKKTYFVIATGEMSLYANIILKKGIVK